MFDVEYRMFEYMIQNTKDNMQEQNLIQMECNSWFMLCYIYFFAAAVSIFCCCDRSCHK